MDLLSGVFGIWHKIHEHLLPALLLPPKSMTDLCTELEDQKGSMFDAVTELLATEPPTEFEDEAAMLAWIVKMIPALRRAQEEHRKALKATADTAPSSVLNEREKSI